MSLNSGAKRNANSSMLAQVRNFRMAASDGSEPVRVDESEQYRARAEFWELVQIPYAITSSTTITARVNFQKVRMLRSWVASKNNSGQGSHLRRCSRLQKRNFTYAGDTARALCMVGEDGKGDEYGIGSPNRIRS